ECITDDGLRHPSTPWPNWLPEPEVHGPDVLPNRFHGRLPSAPLPTADKEDTVASVGELGHEVLGPLERRLPGDRGEIHDVATRPGHPRQRRESTRDNRRCSKAARE